MNPLLKKIVDKLHFEFLKLSIRKSQLNFVLAQEAANGASTDVHLREKYMEYTRDISTPEMAVSLECVTLLHRMCKSGSFKRILDLGSGFSSFAFRQYAGTDDGVQVLSVDDDAQWIMKTGSFLKENGLPDSNLIMLGEFLSTDEKDFDLVFLDLNFVHLRRNYIQLAIERCKSGGVIIFDDVHKDEFMFDVLLQTRQQPIQLFDIKSSTLDRFGRFALLGLKN